MNYECCAHLVGAAGDAAGWDRGGKGIVAKCSGLVRLK